MSIEYELKFAADDAALAAIHRDNPGGAEYEMRTTYYDTPDKALSARHITLRLRMENDTAVCTLKAPADQGRHEFEVECDSIDTAIPQLLRLSGMGELPELLKNGVVPVCGAAFHRIAKTISLPGGTVELALDKGFLLGGGKKASLCEVEVELKAGNPAVAKGYAMQLALAYNLIPEKHSKFKRALALSMEDSHGF